MNTDSNFDAIRRKAILLGLMDTAEAESMEQRQMLSLMFSSGFSTATSETEDAGRGVGMDIIKETVQNMGGRISVATGAESYTRFSLTFPKA
ncbi:ATP-binding protein [Kingella negevensis]|uniref:ATP-binding protein n=1 Tax=Kingella negevensis TaxID=1522312 RepID=UPI00254EFFF4|nr:ATP-binding protein [Kingella negevensis]MDK4684549.1 ATP-binding protein [Kingella negevensis]MDK4707676.1 ATP-binding protein [Kingella negevensis]MDK4709888.1 ATP-binding protein [Kingella negevensis]